MLRNLGAAAPKVDHFIVRYNQRACLSRDKSWESEHEVGLNVEQSGGLALHVE